LEFQKWAKLGEAFEEILGRVVDAHLLEPDAASPTDSVMVWGI
jgi:hypothetical protein